MLPQGGMPECPAAVAVAKPRRDSWLVEELYDTLFTGDPGARVVRTRFPGVLLVYSSLEPARLVPLFRRVEHSFLQRLVPAQRCIAEASPGDPERLVEELARLLAAAEVKEAKLLAVMRGAGKEVYGGSRSLEQAMARAGVKPSRRAHRYVVALESVDRLLVAAAGITRGCGLGCILVDFTPLKLT